MGRKKKYADPKDLLKARQENVKRLNEAKKNKMDKNKRNLNPGVEDDANNPEKPNPPAEKSEVTGENIHIESPQKASDIITEGLNLSKEEINKALNEKEKAMPIPDIENISPFNKAPIIHAHAGENGNGQATSAHQPEIPVEPAGPNPPDMNSGSEFNQNHEPIPVTPNPEDPKIKQDNEQFLKNEGFETNMPGEGVPQPEMNSIHASRKDAEATFDLIFNSVNNLVKTYAVPFVVVKDKHLPNTISLMDKEGREAIRYDISKLNEHITADVMMDKEDYEMLKEPAVTVLMKKGMVVTPEQQLMIALITVLQKHIVKSIYHARQRKKYLEHIEAAIDAKMGGITRDMREMRTEMSQMRDELKTYQERLKKEVA